jgi:RNA polymerase sigma-70 factor (ECF subfamily)
MVKFSPDPGPTPDADLVEALNRGDVGAFDELYERHRDWVVRLAHRFTGNGHDALDVLQDTFAYLLKTAPRLQLHVKLTTFLYPVVKNLAMTILRRRGRAVTGDAILEQAVAPDPIPAESSKAELTAVLSGLSKDHREVLLMRFVDDLLLEEIADALGIPLGTVKSRLHNALGTLRNDPRTRRYFEA